MVFQLDVAFLLVSGCQARAIDVVLGMEVFVDVRWFRRQRRYVSVIALSLVLKLIIVGLHVPMAVAAVGVGIDGDANAASTQAPSFTQFIICTPRGVKTLTLDENGAPIDVPNAPQATTDCGLCSVLHAGLAALAPEAVSVASPYNTSPALLAAHEAPCTPSAPRLALGHDPPRL